jgi:23S rRNA pseudouridine2605 synthase
VWRNREEGEQQEQRPRRPRVTDGEQREYRPRPRTGEEGQREYRPRPRFHEEGQREYRPRTNDGERREQRPRRPRIAGGEQQEYRQRPRFAPRDRGEISEEEKETLRRNHYSKKKVLAYRLKGDEDMNAELRLNRYISMSGICSRRDADELILAGRVKVNGEVVNTVGMKVKRSDEVMVDDKPVVPERKVYLVLNKPKDFVTTMDDPLERKTVMSLVEKACRERIYPVGRLDRHTTGVLLFTNDGDLAKKLTHPSYDHKKIYQVFLNKPLEEPDFKAIAEGIELEDGFIKADEIEYTSPDNKSVGIEIHSGKNRIVRRIFEHFGYQILRLDRVYFAGITKKRLPRGKWRYLTIKEVNMLKAY